MPQLLALEWNGSEARMVVAASHGERVTIEQAFSVPLGARQAGDEQPEMDVGRQIAAALAARGIGRPDTLVAIGRSSIELRQLSLPPAPAEELPDLVRFEAMREFNELDESWLLDFVRIDDSGEGPHNVLAAAIGPEVVARIEQTCETAGLKPRRLILRPCAAASLLGRTPSPGPVAPDRGRPRLLVDLLADEADLTVMLDRKVIFLRTARMSGNPLREAEHAEALLAEIRRTMAAAQNQLGGQQVQSIVFCGPDREHAELAKWVAEKLSTPTELFDPFAGLNLGRELQSGLPDHPGRFAPLLGMALAELEQTGHAIDFLHPRRRPEPPRKYQKYLLASGVAVLLLVLVFAYGRMQRSRLAKQSNSLSKRSRELDAEIKKAKKQEAAVAEIEKWMATDVVWLDELRELSGEFPAAKQAVLTELKLRPASRGGRMDLEGLVEDSSVISRMHQDLRDPSHRVEGGRSAEETSNRLYSWWFESSVYVDREEP